MRSVADSIGIRSHGAEKFAFCAGANVVTVRLASGHEGSTLARPSIVGIALWYQRDEVERIASAFFAMTYANPADDPRKKQ